MRNILKSKISKLALVGAVSIFSTQAFADSFLQGSIVEVRDADKTIVIDSVYQGQVVVKILPTTRIELDDCGLFGTDNIFEDGNFKDLKVGRYAEVDGYYPQAQNNQNPNQAMPVARKLEVKCIKKAY